MNEIKVLLDYWIGLDFRIHFKMLSDFEAELLSAALPKERLS